MKKNKQNLPLGIILMLTASLLTCVGQLCWKLSASGALWPCGLGNFPFCIPC